MTPNSQHAYTGRTITLITLLVGLAGAAAPAVAQLDLSSTAGVVAGIVALSAVVVKYLEGWQRYEARLDSLEPASPVEGAGEEPRVTAAVEAPVADVDEEPAAPQPGELELTLEPADIDDEPADVPDPPTDEEIAAAAIADVRSFPVLDEHEAPRDDDDQAGPVAGLAG